MNKPISSLLTNLLFASIISVSTISLAQPSTDEGQITAGSTLVLNETIRFPAFSASVDIQNGQTRSGLFNLDNYYANCTLELRAQSNNVRLIEPDRFIIYKISTGIEQVLSKPVMVAGVGFFLANGANDEAYITKMYLKSDKQKDVELLTCQHWEDPTGFPVHLTTQQIKQTLGPLFTLETN